ncbi:MAG: chorismate-binding protein [Candidatus Eremiobacteraeota bacterium]|nr:chorismate-binding protein [Candidatus Eremiobacteraeota bacterium]
MRETVKPGGSLRLIPVVKSIALTRDASEIFSLVSGGGHAPHAMFLESADIVPFYGKMSIMVIEPCLRICGRGTGYRLEALDRFGIRFIDALMPDLALLGSVIRNEPSLAEGILPPVPRHIDEQARLRAITPFHVLRLVLGKLTPAYWPGHLFCGLFGALTYDFIDTFESLPPPLSDPLNEDDFTFYYGTTLLVADHAKHELAIVSNAMVITDEEAGGAFLHATEVIERIERLILNGTAPPEAGSTGGAITTSQEFSREEYMSLVETMKSHIVEGDVFQAVPSRTVTAEGIADPWAIYRELRSLNPSPYMFYMNDGRGVLLGASPEMLLRVTGTEKPIVETRPIAGTRPRGIAAGVPDADLDSRYEVSLKTDFKELAEHSMLIDLARNDIARVAKPGTRVVESPYCTEKYSHVQHLVTTVKGELKEDIDAFHAYLSVMNAGTLTGAPKLKAMELLRRCEKFKRGYYGGACGYFSRNGEMDSCIIIRSMRILEGKAHLRAGAGIVYDSIAESEYEETEKKLAAPLTALKRAAER